MVSLRDLDFQHGTTTNIQSLALNAPAGADQILLHLNHQANATTVTASFSYLQGGTVIGTQTFTSTAPIFNNENWTRADIIADAPALTDSTLGGTYGTLDINQAGAWTYTLNNALTATQALAQGQHATDTFHVQVADQYGATDTRTISIDVAGSNDAPVMQTPAVLRQVFEDQSTPNVTATGLAQFTDVDLTDTHTVSAVLQSSGLSGGQHAAGGLLRRRSAPR